MKAIAATAMRIMAGTNGLNPGPRRLVGATVSMTRTNRAAAAFAAALLPSVNSSFFCGTTIAIPGETDVGLPRAQDSFLAGDEDLGWENHPKPTKAKRRWLHLRHRTGRIPTVDTALSSRLRRWLNVYSSCPQQGHFAFLFPRPEAAAPFTCPTMALL